MAKGHHLINIGLIGKYCQEKKYEIIIIINIIINSACELTGSAVAMI
jgi:hypothetical protein